MKAQALLTTVFTFVISLLPRSASAINENTTINAANHLSYAANLGWVDWRGNVFNGAVIGQYICSGYIYSANVGWIHLGSGAPVNQVQYQNNSAADYGVNHDGVGNLRGYAYGANIGWISFENTGAPTLDLATGKLSGAIYSANCGWVSLSTASAFVQTDTMDPGTLAANGLPVAWLISKFGTTVVDPLADADGDGQSNLQEYLAGTHPLQAGHSLRVTAYNFTPGGTSVSLTWESVPTRFYKIWKSPDLTAGSWTDSGLELISPTALSTSAGFSDVGAPSRFYRVEALVPLQPAKSF